MWIISETLWLFLTDVLFSLMQHKYFLCLGIEDVGLVFQERVQMGFCTGFGSVGVNSRCSSDVGEVLQGLGCRDGAAGMGLQGWGCRDGAAGMGLQGWGCRDGAAGMVLQG